MRESGRMTCSTGEEWKHGQMALATKETMPLAGSMEWGCTSGMMAPNMQGSGKRIKLVELVSTSG